MVAGKATVAIRFGEATRPYRKRGEERKDRGGREMREWGLGTRGLWQGRVSERK